MNHVSFTLDPTGLLDPQPSFRYRDFRRAPQVKFEPDRQHTIWMYLSAAEAREIAAAFTRLAVEIEADDDRADAEQQLVAES